MLLKFISVNRLYLCANFSPLFYIKVCRISFEKYYKHIPHIVLNHKQGTSKSVKYESEVKHFTWEKSVKFDRRAPLYKTHCDLSYCL